ncbi:MAG TPA: hypothetical protein VLG67_01285 [Candidatus Saccharimonadales bacterium]|nr:hypothetical protein [Candidatus Saccharimonadales bacterium]
MNDQSEPQNQDSQQLHPLNRKVHPHISKAVLALLIMVGIGGTALTVSSLGQSQDNRSRAAENPTQATTLPNQASIRIKTLSGKKANLKSAVLKKPNDTKEIKRVDFASDSPEDMISLDPGVYKVQFISNNPNEAPLPDKTIVVEKGKVTDIVVSTNVDQ